MEAYDTPTDEIIDGALLFGFSRRFTVQLLRGRSRLCLIKKKAGFYAIELLTPSQDPQWALPTWGGAENFIICGSEEEAVNLAKDYLKEPEPI